MIVYSCPYVPAEWIAAHGLEPCRLLPDSAVLKGPVDVAAGVCPYMRGFANAAGSVSGVKGIVLTTVCDQMRRANDFIEQRTDVPSFLMNVPSTWQTSEAVKLYLSELRRLGRFLEELGGRTPDEGVLWRVMDEYEGKRKQLRGLRGVLSAKEYSRAIANFSREPGKFTVMASDAVSKKPAKRAVPVGLIGGPLTTKDFDLFDILERFGGEVVLDGTESGERTLPAPFNRSHAGKDDPLKELADCYFGHIPDVFRRPNSELYKWLGYEIDSRCISGVILLRHIWCDKWHAEVQRMKEWLKVPLVDLELDGESSDARNRERIQAFMETLR